MTEEIDIWRSAKLLVEGHGKEATVHAAMRADELLAKGDIDGQRTWMRILRAVEELLRQRGDDSVH